MKLAIPLAGLTVIALLILWVGYAPGPRLADGQPLTPPANPPIAAGKGQLSPVLIKCPKAMYIETPKDMPPSVRNLGEKPRAAFHAPPGTGNIALNCPVTSSDSEPIIGQLAQVTDGVKDASEGNWVELGPGLQWVQIDLGRPADIYGLCVWHWHRAGRIYQAVVVQVSNDPDFRKNVTTVFNNDKTNTAKLGIGADAPYVENFQGELMPIRDGVQGRYVRLYSRGSTDNDQNQYTEVEVYGIKQ